jgi:cobaltochelatase CobT
VAAKQAMLQILRHIQSYFSRAPVPTNSIPYHVYTREFDVIIEAEKLDSVLGRLPRDQEDAHAEAWATFSCALQGWRTKAHLTALEAADRIRIAVDAEQLADTAISILVDQSGSMRGQSMLLVAAACDIAQDFLVHLGVKTEVLGFTTVRWKGGKSRELWVRRGRRPLPGRLSDLLHIVYRSADDRRASTGGNLFKPMLRPDLPKENVDGEAIEWAVGRLMAMPKQRRTLLVLSDGVPADDSTLIANDAGFLDRHLRKVIRRIETSKDVKLVGIGIGFDTSAYYQSSLIISSVDDLGSSLIAALENSLRK